MIFEGNPAKLEAYFRFIADRLGLKDWDFAFPREDPSPGSRAEITTNQGERRSSITFDRSWPEWTEADLLNTVLHEALHAHTVGVVHIIDGMRPWLGEMAWNPINHAIDIQIENATSDLARVLAPFYTLPLDWEKEYWPARK